MHGHGAGDAQTLLLAAGQADARVVETVLDLVPQVGAAQGPLDQIVGVGLGDLAVVQAHAGEHVLADGHRRERVRALEDHADVAADLDRVDVLGVQVAAFEQHLALDVGAGDDLVHAVERAQHGRLAAAGRADEGGDLVRLDVQVDILDGQEVAVIDVQMVDINALSHCFSLFPRAACYGLPFRLDGEDLRHDAADQVQDQHDEDQGQGCGPGAFHRDGGHAAGVGAGRAVRVELAVLLVDVHR